MNEDVKSENVRIHSRADELIACLEGEIAKRDAELAACRVAVENCEVFRARVAELEARIVWLECEAQVNTAPVSEDKAQGVVMPAELDRAFITGESCDGVYRVVIQSETLKEMQAVHRWLARLNAAPVQQVSVPDDFVCDSKPLQELLNATAMLLETPCQDSATYWAAQLANVEQLLAAPAAPAADAWIVDMYRHLQKVTPYRFKKIQDASITDGGDVMYFHKDRFDAALLADMAAHRAKGVV